MINFRKKIIYTKKYQLKLFLLKNNQKYQKNMIILYRYLYNLKKIIEFSSLIQQTH